MRALKLLGLGLLMLLVVGLLVVALSAPELSDYQDLIHPQMRPQADVHMLVVEAKGDPATTSKQAFSLLFKTYFAIPGVKKSLLHMPAPRARWAVPNGIDPKDWAQVPKEQWIGTYALPVPETVVVLPEGAATAGLPVRLETWRYGTVAEILHQGRYSEEKADIDTLHEFIQAQGYAISGAHEEEYVKGPGMFLMGDPAKYLTIIRYAVVPAPKSKPKA